MNYANLIKNVFWKHNTLPNYLIFFITNKCNARCDHCFYWKNLNNKKEELSLEEIKKISKTMSNLYHINLTGGEPFLRTDLSEIAQILYKNCKLRSVGIPTNGYNPERICKITKKILKSCPDLNLLVSISLDHLMSAHDNIRNFPGLFNKAVKTVDVLKKLNSRNLTVGVNLTLTKENEKDIEKIYSYIRDVIQPDTINPLLVRGNPKNMKTKEVSLHSYEKLISLWTKDIKLNKLKGYSNLPFSSLIMARDILTRKNIIKKIKGEKNTPKCLAGILGGVIYENGDVSPCEILSESFGNIRDYDYDLKKIWFCEKANKIRKKIKKERCSCTHECFQNINTVFHIKTIPKLLTETIT